MRIPTGGSLCGIRCIDGENGLPVPLVSLATVDQREWISDNHGWIAIPTDSGGSRDIWFTVEGQGYVVPADGFGFRGVRLKIAPGSRHTIRLKRTGAAQRRLRLTGTGRHEHAKALGESGALSVGGLGQQVVGQDSAQAVVFQKTMHWFWGDTAVEDYPLGNFRTTGATATFPRGSNGPSHGLEFRYRRRPDGRLAPMVPGTEPGMVWISGLTVLDPGKHNERMVAYYARMKDLGTRLEHGHLIWDSKTECFRIHSRLPEPRDWRHLDGHPIRLTDDMIPRIAGGFTFPVVRCAENAVLSGPSSAWEAFSCLDAAGNVRRRGERAHYDWRADSPPIEPALENELLYTGRLEARDARFLPVTEDGARLVPHGGSVAWNPFRRRWVCVFTDRRSGPTPLGNVWYSEAKSSVGPWRRAALLARFENQSFYNPVHHAFLDQLGGRVIWFEGTFSKMFTAKSQPKGRFEYNQIMHRLDLDDPKLAFVREESTDE